MVLGSCSQKNALGWGVTRGRLCRNGDCVKSGKCLARSAFDAAAKLFPCKQNVYEHLTLTLDSDGSDAYVFRCRIYIKSEMRILTWSVFLNRGVRPLTHKDVMNFPSRRSPFAYLLVVVVPRLQYFTCVPPQARAGAQGGRGARAGAGGQGRGGRRPLVVPGVRTTACGGPGGARCPRKCFTSTRAGVLLD